LIEWASRKVLTLAIAESQLATGDPTGPAVERPRWRVVLSWVITGLAAVLVFYGLVGPTSSAG